jgi:hypothetical protein
MSITLTNTASAAIGGTTVESDLNAACTYFEMGYPDSLRVFISYGNTAGQVFTPGAVLPKVVITIDLKLGGWSSTNGLSGILTTPQLTSMQTIALNIRNGLETLVASGVVPGTFVAWTTGMF